MDIEAQAAQLAKRIGISTADVLSMAKCVAGAIDRDGVAEIAAQQSEEMREEFVGAYLESEVKKFGRFVDTYLTRDGAKDALAAHVFAQVTARAAA